MNFLDNLFEKNRIRKEIRDLQSMIRELQRLIADYNTCKTDIDTNINNWVSARTTYYNILLEPVKVESYFEGTSAENVKNRLIETIAEMNNANVKMVTVKGAIPNQIELIEDKITELEEKIAGLETELAALG